ncbi:MAG: class I SAM-dependent methyltransferase [Intrasporangium sp.]|uniref:class I SAM-dependent methyltransferase n=1 Tax=Intrasporangium sp. TaxID=1925024 RepID=UPI002648C59A|nr:class I SAM-dependent methyltransferase [Intrasporangium sp.]MDN5794491.1 class I SAM-dependent methyltransferase [Intrasporangium sp.]
MTQQATTATDDLAAADRELKAKHRGMWALGNYPAVASDIIPSMGPVLVAAAGIGPGTRVLDVAAGSGNVAVPAALAGAEVIASDLTPDLLAAGRWAAQAAGANLTWQEADVEALPYADGQFDAVVSSVGIMFAPHHQRAADETLRVTRPGGTIAIASWTPQGFIGQMFATMKPYVAPPPPGAQPAPLWGSEDHVRELFGDRVTGLTFERRDIVVDHFDTGAEFRDYFKDNYGPTIAAYRGLSDSPDRAASLDAELAALGDRGLDPNGTMRWEYLVVTAHKA